jgi:hypothetical protein
MNPRAVAFVLPFIVAAAAASADPAAQPPAIDPGLWQWTTTVVSGAKSLSPDQLAQMPPSVRAAVEAHMRTAMQPHTSQGCLTDQKLRAGFNLTHRTQDDCSFHINTSSAAAFDELSTCHSNHFGDILSHITFSVRNRETVEGTIEIHTTHDPAPEIINLAGKRVGAACGSVMP